MGNKREAVLVAGSLFLPMNVPIFSNMGDWWYLVYSTFYGKVRDTLQNEQIAERAPLDRSRRMILLTDMLIMPQKPLRTANTDTLSAGIPPETTERTIPHGTGAATLLYMSLCRTRTAHFL